MEILTRDKTVSYQVRWPDQERGHSNAPAAVSPSRTCEPFSELFSDWFSYDKTCIIAAFSPMISSRLSNIYMPLEVLAKYFVLQLELDMER